MGNALTRGASRAEMAGCARQRGWWVEVADGWFPAVQPSIQREILAEVERVWCFDRVGDQFEVPAESVMASEMVAATCRYRGVTWEALAVHDGDGSIFRELFRDRPWDAGLSDDYVRRHRRRFPVPVSSPGMYVSLGFDGEADWEYLDALAAGMPGAERHHPYSGSPYAVTVTARLLDVSDYREAVEWSTGPLR